MASAAEGISQIAGASRGGPPRDGARWSRVQELFEAALQRSSPAAWLSQACGGDAGLREEVEALLAEHSRGSPLLDGGLAEVAARMGEEPPRPLVEVGPYRILRLLGAGGMGTVYLGEHAELGQLVAVKVLPDAALSPARRERFAAEQRTLAMLDHPSIARIHDADVLPDGTPWFAMEYVDGLPLTAYCASRRTSLAERLALFLSVCGAVEHAHAHAVIHRDLKPSNILVRADGTVKLVDFGIAKHVGRAGGADPTRTGPRLLTPAYASPEELRGDPAGAQADVWALGVVLYQLLTGRLPFGSEGLTPGEAEHRVLHDEPERPSSAARCAPAEGAGMAPARASRCAWADLDVLCLTALQRDVRRRYRSVEALARDLARYCRSEPLEARPESASYRLGKFVQRHRRGVAASAAAAALATAGVTVFAVGLGRAHAEAVAEAARALRIQRFVLSLFEGGDPAAGPAEDLRVVTLVERGAQEVAALDAEPVAQADLLQTLGGIALELGQLERADALLRAALERRQVHGAGPAAVSEGLTALARLRSAQARHDEAEELTRRALAAARRDLPPGHPALARVLSALGTVLEDRGRYADAAPVLEEAARLQASSGTEAPELLETLDELAHVRFHAGQYDASEAVHRRVLGLQRSLYGERHPRVADTLINLGSIEEVRGRYPEAERLHREALAIFEGHYGKDHPETAQALRQVRRAVVAQGRNAEAEELLRRATAIKEGPYEPGYPLEDRASNEAHQRRAVEIYRASHGERHFTHGVALVNLGALALERRDYRAAEAHVRRALEVYAASLPPDHCRIGIARVILGRALLRAGKPAEAEASTRAGYEILKTKRGSAGAWLAGARADLADEYAAAGRKAEEATFRGELARGSAGR